MGYALLISMDVHVQVARAHGGSPSAMGLIAANERGANMVLVNEGLAFNNDGLWTYLCPTLWGDDELSASKAPLAASLDGRSSWVVGSDDLYLAEAGTLTKLGRTDLMLTGSFVALEGSAGQVFGLRIGSMGTEIVRIEPTATPLVWSSADYYSALAVTPDAFHLARVLNEREVEFETLDRQGQRLARYSAALDSQPARVFIRPTSGGLYAVMFDGNLHYDLGLLVDGHWQKVQEAEASLAGPQAGPDGQLWVGLGGKLHKITDAGFESTPESRYVSCLDHWQSQAYACVGSELHWLTDEGLGPVIFQLQGFNGPNPALVPMALQERCGFQWQLFRIDLERTGLSPQDYPPSMSSAPLASDAAMPGDMKPNQGAAPSPMSGADGPANCAALRLGVAGSSAQCWLLLGLSVLLRWFKRRK